jgi:glucoamylase
VELLAALEARYGSGPPAAKYTRWRNETPVQSLETGRTLLIEDREPFTLHLGRDGWQHVEDLQSQPLPFELWGVALDADRYRAPGALNFTRRYGDRWEGQDHTVELTEAPRPRTLVHMGAQTGSA